MKYPIEILEHYWNFHEFKPQQEAIIEAVLANEDCIALLPTGGGKSIYTQCNCDRVYIFNSFNARPS